MTDYEVNTRQIALVGLLGLIVTTIIVFAVQVLYYRYLVVMETSPKFNQPPKQLEALLESQRARLTDYRPIDKAQGIVAIPIRQAMELVVTELSKPETVDSTPGDLQEEPPDET